MTVAPQNVAVDAAVAVLVASHNRREKTLACLRSLFRAADTAGTTVHVYWVDDGCTDGTRESVSALAGPITILNGSGDLYWAGGMRLAWGAAVHGRHEFVLLLNDDVVLEASSVREMLAQAGTSAIVVGTCVDQHGEITYGGLQRRARWRISLRQELDPRPGKAVDTCNANILLVPFPVFTMLGGLDSRFRHAWADLDLGFRAWRTGVPVVLAGGVQGSCETNASPRLDWEAPGLTVGERWKRMRSPHGLLMGEYSYYLSKHAPLIGWYLRLMPIARFVRASLRRQLKP